MATRAYTVTTTPDGYVYVFSGTSQEGELLGSFREVNLLRSGDVIGEMIQKHIDLKKVSPLIEKLEHMISAGSPYGVRDNSGENFD